MKSIEMLLYKLEKANNQAKKNNTEYHNLLKLSDTMDDIQIARIIEKKLNQCDKNRVLIRKQVRSDFNA